MNANVPLGWVGQIRPEGRMLRLIIHKLLLCRERKLRETDAASKAGRVKPVLPGQHPAHFLESNRSAHWRLFYKILHTVRRPQCNLVAVLAYCLEEELLKLNVLIILLVFVSVALPAYTQSPSDTGSAPSSDTSSAPSEISSTPPANRIEAEHPDKRLFGVLPNYRT